MKPILIFLKCSICMVVFIPCWSTLIAQDAATRFKEAGTLFAAGKHEDALALIRKVDQIPDMDEALKKDVRWAYVIALTKLAKSARLQEDWEKAREHTQECLDVLDKSADEFSGAFLNQLQLSDRRFRSYKNMVIACYGLNDLDQADQFRGKLYEAYGEKTLPNGIDEHFNFEFFRQDKKNVWGYEYYPTLGDPETKGSFSKIVYFVYNTNEDGSDKDQLYRLHVLKIHKVQESDKDLYVLTRRWKTDDQEEEVSRTLHEYVYSVPIDLKQIRKDIREVIKQMDDK